MSDFKTKMQQIRFRLGLRPQTPLWELTALLRPLAGFGGPTSKGRGRGKEREGEGLSLPKVNFLVTSLLGTKRKKVVNKMSLCHVP